MGVGVGVRVRACLLAFESHLPEVDAQIVNTALDDNAPGIFLFRDAR